MPQFFVNACVNKMLMHAHYELKVLFLPIHFTIILKPSIILVEIPIPFHYIIILRDFFLNKTLQKQNTLIENE